MSALKHGLAEIVQSGVMRCIIALEQPAYEGLQDILIGADLAKERQLYGKVVTRDFV